MSKIEQDMIEANDWKIEARGFRSKLMTWGKKNFQLFPWRETNDPYRLLLAELMLHRTRAPQVEPVFLEFMQNYPDINALRNASLEDIQHHLYSLGLHWRVPLIYEMVAVIFEEFDGKIPQGKEQLESLPGVSQYISGAVRCFAWKIPDPIIDTNTVRIVGRLFGLKITDSSRRTKYIRELITRLVDREKPDIFNYAMLDLAHMVCVPGEPKCEECPVRNAPCAHNAG